MRGTRVASLVLTGIVLTLSSCNREQAAEKYHPAKLEETDQKGIMRVTLDARAAERIGLATAPIREESVSLAGRAVTRSVVPYGAIMYDKNGDTWTFTNPEPLVFVRRSVVVENIDGDRVILAQGPPPGTVIVTVGAAELMGAEHKYGH